MSAVITANWEGQPSDQPPPELDLDVLAPVIEPRPAEPRRVRMPRPLVWGFLALFSLAITVMGVWGLAHSTLTYGMSAVDSATTWRLEQIQSRLKEANAPEAALRQMAIAVRPGVNIGDALEALANTEETLEPMSGNAAIALAQAELLAIHQELIGKRYGGSGGPTTTPLPTVPLTVP